LSQTFALGFAAALLDAAPAVDGAGSLVFDAGDAAGADFGVAASALGFLSTAVSTFFFASSAFFRSDPRPCADAAFEPASSADDTNAMDSVRTLSTTPPICRNW
jgi:hypothetical protein